MNQSRNYDVSDEPATLQRLDEAQKERLTTILDHYLSEVESGRRPDREALLSEHADLRDALVEYLDKLDELNRFMGGDTYSPEIIGKQLGDYRLIRELGRGGMGVVYLAQQVTLDRQVAVKVLPFASIIEEKYIERFKNEAKAAAQLEHPNIVPVYSVGFDQGMHYYAMRYIEGASLDQIIASRRKSMQSQEPTPWSKVELAGILQQFAEVAEALYRAHTYGVVHRDIKPSNLLRDNHNKLWLADFGLARFQTDRELTRTGEMVGTMRYMSPEQATGKNELVDHRTDIYSLGVTLYETLTLQPAVPGSEGAQLLRKIESESPIRPRKLCPGLPADVQTLIEKAISKYRDDRYASAAAMAEDLRRASRGYPILANPPSVWLIAGRWLEKRMAMLAVAAAVLILATVGLSIGLVLINQERRDAEANLSKAKIYFRKLLDSIEGYVESADELATLPGAEPASQHLLAKVLHFFQDFAAQAGDDPEFQADIAWTYARMGVLTEKLESTQAAIPFYERAQNLFASIATNATNSGDLELPQVENLNALGLALTRLGQVAAAEKAYTEAIRIQQRERALPTPGEWQNQIAITKNNLGLLYQKRGQMVKAASLFDESIAILRGGLKGHDDSKTKRVLALANNNRAILQVEDDPSAAEALLNEALELQLEIAERTKNTLVSSLDLMTTYSNLAKVATVRSDWRQVEMYNRNVIRIARELMRISPRVELYQQELAFASNNLGMALKELGDVEGANAAFNEAIRLLQQRQESVNDNPALLGAIGSAWNNRGMLLFSSRELTAAGNCFEKAIECHQRAFELSPESEVARKNLGTSLANQAHLLRQLKDGDRELAVIRKRRELWRHSPDRILAIAEELAPVAGQDLRYLEELVESVKQAKREGRAIGNDFWERPAIRPIAPQLRSLIN